MAWIESHQSLGAHPKTRRLARALGVSLPTAIGHLHLLWWWALDYAEDGKLDRYKFQDIADACLWEGDAIKIWNGLRDAGFVDEDQANHIARIHDWDDYAGKLIDRRVRNRERMKQLRAQHVRDTTSHVDTTTETRAEVVQSPLSSPPNPLLSLSPSYPTEPNHTIPDLKNKSGAKAPFVLPEWVSKELWESFLEMRKKARAVPTPNAQKLLITALMRLKAEGNSPDAVLEQSIMNGWKGLFAIKQNGGNNGKSQWGPATDKKRPLEIYTTPPGLPLLGSKPDTML